MNDSNGWKKFQKASFNRKRLSKQALRAESLTKKHAHKFVIQRIRALRDVRQHIASWLVMLVALIGVVALQMMWYQKGYKTEAAVSGGTYAEGVQGPIETLNPLYASTDAEQSATQLLFSRLLDYDKTGNLRDDVATNISIDETQKIYTIDLRKDVKWHDGKKLTADDVVYTVDIMKNPETRAVMRNNWIDISVKKVSDFRVEFTLPAPYATFQHALTFAILPKHILSQASPGTLRENTYSISPTGSGPFKLRLLQTISSSKDSQKIVHMNKWKEYYRGTAKLERFELHAYDKAESLPRAVRNGDVNAVAGLAPNDEVPSSLVKQNIPINSGVYAIFNVKSPGLSDVSVRQALQMGSNTAAVREAAGIPNLPLDLPFIPTQIDATELPKKPEYNLAAAKQLLDKSGWKLEKGIRTKDGVALTLRVATIKDATYGAVVDELSKQWKLLGIEVEKTVFDPSLSQGSFAQDVLQPRMFDILINELAIGGDADVYAYWHSSQAQAAGYNFSNYSSDISDDNLASARARIDEDLRNRKYGAFAEQWITDAPAIGLYQSSIRYAHTNGVSGVSASSSLPNAVDRYSDVLYWTAETAQVYKTP